ncbi:MAG: hypothetical protein NUW23_01655 [Firmicutes bacterium]|nr:hypothetical protein [Bacillota bacterium]
MRHEIRLTPVRQLILLLLLIVLEALVALTYSDFAPRASLFMGLRQQVSVVQPEPGDHLAGGGPASEYRPVTRRFMAYAAVVVLVFVPVAFMVNGRHDPPPDDRITEEIPDFVDLG